MTFSIHDLSEKQLELIGLSKKDILNMPPRTYKALMSGNRTSLIRFNKLNIPGLEGGSLDAKLSLERESDNSVSIRFHPINQIPKNTFNLSKEDIELLKNSETNFIEKQFPNGKTHLVGIDRQTNEFVAIAKDTIEAPKKINGIELTDKQINDFKEGKDISVGGERFRLNPNDELGISSSDNKSTVSSLEFKHSKYNSSELLIDLALLTTGAGSIFMIGHLADLLILTSAENLKGKNKQHFNKMIGENETLRNALAKASPEIANKFEKGHFLTPKDLKQLIESHLDRHVQTGTVNDLVVKQGYSTRIIASITDENKTGGIQEQQNQNLQTQTSKKDLRSKENHVYKTDDLNQQSRKKVTPKM